MSYIKMALGDKYHTEAKKMNDFVDKVLKDSPYHRDMCQRGCRYVIAEFMDTRSKRLAGVAYCRNKKIGINPHYYVDQGFEVMKEVLIHELAHVIQFVLYPKAKQAHGPEWKGIMRTLGVEPNTYHSMTRPAVPKKTQAAKPKRKNLKTRYVYRLGDGPEGVVYLTKRQHEDVQLYGSAWAGDELFMASDFRKKITYY